MKSAIAAPQPRQSPDSIYSRECLNLDDLHSIFCDYGEKIAATQHELERIKEVIGRDYVISRVDVLNIQNKF